MVESTNIMSVNVKWGKEVFTDVEVDLNESVDMFRAQLYCLSNVSVDTMKINVKGTLLKDGDDLAKVFAEFQRDPVIGPPWCTMVDLKFLDQRHEIF